MTTENSGRNFKIFLEENNLTNKPIFFRGGYVEAGDYLEEVRAKSFNSWGDQQSPATKEKIKPDTELVTVKVLEIIDTTTGSETLKV